MCTTTPRLPCCVRPNMARTWLKRASRTRSIVGLTMTSVGDLSYHAAPSRRDPLRASELGSWHQLAAPAAGASPETCPRRRARSKLEKGGSRGPCRPGADTQPGRKGPVLVRQRRALLQAPLHLTGCSQNQQTTKNHRKHTAGLLLGAFGAAPGVARTWRDIEL